MGTWSLLCIFYIFLFHEIVFGFVRLFCVVLFSNFFFVNSIRKVLMGLKKLYFYRNFKISISKIINSNMYMNWRAFSQLYSAYLLKLIIPRITVAIQGILSNFPKALTNLHKIQHQKSFFINKLTQNSNSIYCKRSK